jgi:hypothetical protein
VASACGEEARRGLGAKRGTPAKIEPGDRPPIPSVIAAVIAITPPPTPLAKMTSDTMPYTVKLIATFAQMGTPARSNTPAMILPRTFAATAAVVNKPAAATDKCNCVTRMSGMNPAIAT